MIVNAECHVEGLIDLGDGAADVQHEAIWMSGFDGEVVALRESHHGCIIGLARSELVSELFRDQIMAIIGADGVIDFPQQLLQAIGVAYRQANRQIQTLRCRQLADWCEPCETRWNVAGKNALS